MKSVEIKISCSPDFCNAVLLYSCKQKLIVVVAVVVESHCSTIGQQTCFPIQTTPSSQGSFSRVFMHTYERVK